MNEATTPRSTPETKSVPYVAERPRRFRVGRWLLWLSLFVLVVLGILYFWQLRSGSRELEQAKALADAQDPLWRIADFPLRVPKVPREQDAALVMRQAASKFPKENPGLSLGELNMVLRGQDPRLTLFTMTQRAAPCNRRLHPFWLDKVQKGQAATQACRESLKPLAGFKAGSFATVSDPIKQIFAPEYETIVPVAETIRQEALVDGIAGKDSAWEKLALALHLQMLPDEPSLSNLQLHFNGLARTLVITEWLLGQRSFAEKDLARWQERLTSLLRHTLPMKNAFRFHRVLAMDLADAQRTDAGDFKTEFGYARFLLGTTIQYSAAEGIRLATEGIEKVDLPLRDYISWLNEIMRRFDIDGNPLRAYPYTLYVMYLLPKFTRTALDFIEYQQRLRLGLVGLACERYRLRSQKFPAQPEQLRDLFAPAVYEELLGANAPVKIYFYQTPFGMVLTIFGGSLVPEDPQDWEERVCMNDQGTRILLGFRLYNPDQRGEPAAPLTEIRPGEQPK
jgi:hypothetical protein